MSIPSSQSHLTTPTEFRNQLFQRMWDAFGKNAKNPEVKDYIVYLVAQKIFEEAQKQQVLNIGFVRGEEATVSKIKVTPEIFKDIRNILGTLKNRTIKISLCVDRHKVHKEANSAEMSRFLEKVETASLSVFEKVKTDFAEYLKKSNEISQKIIADWRKFESEYREPNQQGLIDAYAGIDSATQTLADNKNRLEMLEKSSLATLLTELSERREVLVILSPEEKSDNT